MTRDVKPYEYYLYFVFITLIIRVLPLLSEVLHGVPLYIGFTLLTVFTTSFVTKKIASFFMNFCLYFNLKLPYLYTVYLILYVSAFTFFS